MAKPRKIITIVAITTYILPELRNASAISTDCVCWANAVIKDKRNIIRATDLFMLVYAVSFVFN
jgi:hypothetical protein